MNSRCAPSVKMYLRASHEALTTGMPVVSRLRQPESLEQIPECLVIDLVVVLHFRRFDEGTKSSGGAIGRGLFQFCEPLLYVGSQHRANVVPCWANLWACHLSSRKAALLHGRSRIRVVC